MKKLLFFLAFVSTVSFANAQLHTFAKSYYSSYYTTQAFSFINTFDNKYMLAGEENGPLVLKIDSLGNSIWAKTIGSTNNGTGFYSIITTMDSCYVLAGSIYNAVDSTYDILCVKINSSGDTLWTKDIDMGYDDYALSVQQTFDGGYILAGYSSQNTAPLSMIAVVKLDAIGNLTWGKTFTGGNYNNIAYAVKQMPDSGYIVTGYLDSLSASDGRAFLMKLTSIGNISWAKKQLIVSSNYTLCSDVIVSKNSFICYLGINSTSNNNIIMKTDFSGNVLWSKYYNPCFGGGVPPIPKLHSISDSIFIFESENWFTKIDSSGNPILNVLSYGINDVLETHDKRFMILSNSQFTTKEISPISGGWDICLTKTDSIGNSNNGGMCSSECSTTSPTIASIKMDTVSFIISTTAVTVSSHPNIANASLTARDGCVIGSIEESKADKNAIQVYPNPAIDNLTIEAPQKAMTEISNIQGQTILQQQIQQGKTDVDISGFAKGVYILRLLSNDKTEVARIVKE